MTTYYVDGKNGSDNAAGGSGTPWKTPAKALAVVTNGDTVKFRGSKTDSTTYYTDSWVATVAGVTWENDTGHTPTWHGGYHTSDSAAYTLTGSEPGKPYSAMIKVAAHNVTLRGLRVQYVGGVGYTVATVQGGTAGVENVLITQCESAYTYGAALVLNSGDADNRVKDAEISYCTFIGMGVGKFDPDKEEGDRGSDAVQGSIQLLYCEDTHVHHNLFAYGFGEGVNVGRNSTRTTLEYNTIHTMDHIHIAIVRCVECDVRYNVVYHTKNPNFLGGKSGEKAVPPGIRIGDEAGAKMLQVPHSEKQRVYGNIVIGGSYCFTVQNGGNFDTQMNRAYIGYNTFIGEEAIPALGIPATRFVFKIDDRAVGDDHANSLVENNIIYAPAGVPIAKIAGAGGVAFRNNAWYSADGDSVPTAGRSGTDVTSNPQIANPLKRFIDAYPNPATGATGFAYDNYRLLVNSPLIGAGSNRSATNGLTPPTVTEDIAGGTRSDANAANMRFFDIGALEYGAVDDDDENAVTAAFTQSATAGDVPLAVTFTDTSTEDGTASIDRLVWDFGDGNTAEGTLTAPYTYAQAGTFTPRLTVYDTALNLSDSYDGQTITVTAPRTDVPGTVDVVRQLLPGTVGTRTIAFNLRGQAPSLVLLFFTRTAEVGTATDDAFMCMGAVTATEQWASSFCCNDGVSPSSTEKYFTRDACIATINGGVFGGRAIRSSLGADRLTLEITSAFNGGLLTAVAFAGAQWAGRASDVFLSALNTSSALSPGFAPEWWLFGGTLIQSWAAVETNADFIFGMSDGATQTGYTWRSIHDQDTTRLRAGIMTGGVFRHPSGNGYIVLEPNTATVGVYGADFQRRVGWAALDIAGNTQVQTAQFATPTATGTESYEVGFAPSALLGVVSNQDQVAGPTTTGDAPESFTIIAADTGATYSVCIASENGVGTANSKTMSANGIRLIAPDGTTILAGTLAFTATGFDINWTTVPAARRYFNVTAFGDTPAIAGPIPQFTADDTTPDDGMVQFADLSNANGSAITAWAWTFGDGGESDEQNPEHEYTQTGVYTVSLTVTNANGSETITKVDYIHYTAARPRLLGPYESLPVTRTSIDRLYSDDPASTAYGFHSHAADFDGMELDAQPDLDMTAAPLAPGKALIRLDWANRKFVIVWPDGTTSDFSED